MDPDTFRELPSSTNAVEPHNRSTHPLPLKGAMMATYIGIEIMAKRKGHLTALQKVHVPRGQTRARRKRLHMTQKVHSIQSQENKTQF